MAFIITFTTTRRRLNPAHILPRNLLSHNYKDKAMAYLPTPKRLPWQPPKQDWATHKGRWEGYNTKRWRTISLVFKMDNPVCCTPGCGQPTYYTDHIIRANKCDDPWSASNWQPLCRKCGDSKSGKESAESKKQIKQCKQANADRSLVSASERDQ